jgi:hypothetical protein
MVDKTLYNYIHFSNKNGLDDSYFCLSLGSENPPIKPQKIKRVRRGMRVRVFLPNRITYLDFTSIREASRYLNTHMRNLQKILKGERKQYKGYTIKYI